MTTIEHGITKCGLIFRGLKTVYFGRGAARKLTLVEPADYTKEFWLVVDGERLVKSVERVIDVKLIDETVRKKTFEQTKLPYSEHGVGPDEYINLAAYRRVEIELEDLSSDYCDGFINQEWSQLISAETNLPVVRFPLNLIDEEEYMPPQIRHERSLEAAKAGISDGLKDSALEDYIRSRVEQAFPTDIKTAIEEAFLNNAKDEEITSSSSSSAVPTLAIEAGSE